MSDTHPVFCRFAGFGPERLARFIMHAERNGGDGQICVCGPSGQKARDKSRAQRRKTRRRGFRQSMVRFE